MRATSFLLAAAQLAAAHAFVAPRAWARRPAPTAVSENAQQGWTEYYDEAQQRPYYHNAGTGETTWDAPAAAGAAVAAAPSAASAAPPSAASAASAAAPSATGELYLSAENVERVLAEAKAELGTLFGTSSENRAVGITGDVSLAELEGATVVLRFEGRFWHARPTVLARLANFLQNRIPEIVDVVVEDPIMLTEDDHGRDYEGPPPSAAAW